MAEDNETLHQDRRLQTLVHELDKKVHAIELSDAGHRLEIAYLKGEVAGIRSSTASSFEVQAASKLIEQKVETLAAANAADKLLINERFDVLRKDFGRLTTVLIWIGVTLVGTIVAAFQFKIVIAP